MRVSRLASAVLSIVALAATASACGGGDPPLPQGAYFARLSSSSGSSCNNTGVAGHLGTVTTTKKTALVTASAEASGATITCSVIPGTGSKTFAVEATLTLSTDYLYIRIDKLDASATKETPAVGTVGFSAADTSNLSYNSPKDGCNFFFVPGSEESVAAGRIWIAFTCPSVASGMNTCGLSDGVVALDSCAEAPPEE